MILTLTPDTEALLNSVAAQRGLPLEKTLKMVLVEAQAAAEYDHFDDDKILAELQASVDDHAAGRSMTIDEYRAKALARRQVRDRG